MKYVLNCCNSLHKVCIKAQAKYKLFKFVLNHWLCVYANIKSIVIYLLKSSKSFF